MTLEIKNLHVEVEGKEVLHDVSITFEAGKVHALLGPNGSGKSTLANVIMANPMYTVTSGTILLDGVDITMLKTDERAKKGLFMSFQYPAAIPGVKLTQFMRNAVNTVKGTTYSVVDFHRILKEKMKELDMDASFLKRSLNEGFSGGEKKRAEILQLMMLEPSYALLDETDSGLDVDSMKVVAKNIVKLHSTSKMGIILITHYTKFLEYLNPDEVSVLLDGKVVQQGGSELAHTIEAQGFGGFVQ